MFTGLSFCWVFLGAWLLPLAIGIAKLSIVAGWLYYWLNADGLREAFVELASFPPMSIKRLLVIVTLIGWCFYWFCSGLLAIGFLTPIGVLLREGALEFALEVALEVILEVGCDDIAFFSID
jgi:hypothetical protein